MILPLSNLSKLQAVAEACIDRMPEDSWWGIKFLDIRFLFNFDFSPHIEVFRWGDLYRVKLSGSHEIDPGLSQSQIGSLEFLDWNRDDQVDCDCHFSPWADAAQAKNRFLSALACMEVVYAVCEGCAVVGSNDFVNAQIQDLSESRWNNKLGGYRFNSSQYNRSDLR